MRVVVVAPHPDDETLGCGGTLLRHKAEGDEVHWFNMTSLKGNESIIQYEINTQVGNEYDFSSCSDFNFPTTRLDTIPIGDLVGSLAGLFTEIQPEMVYAPFWGDIHSDHRIVFDAVASCSKWFRHPYIKRIMAYETLSETEFGFKESFKPNCFVNITDYLNKKIEIMKLYNGEMGEMPFPRCEQNIRALATLRGTQSGFMAAEAFMLLKDIR